MTSWLLNFPNINLNIAEPIDEFVRYININYGEVFVAAKKMLSIFINGINGALDMIPWWLMILLVVFAAGRTSFVQGFLNHWNVKSEATLTAEGYPESLVQLYEKNEEARQFVLDYKKNGNNEQPIDISSDVTDGKIPLFLQWDERWGYRTYGDNFLAITGCGPTALSMVYVGLTGDTSMNPYAVAQMAQEDGFYVNGSGSAWSMMTELATKLGLSAQELSLSEDSIRQELSQGHPIICIMGPGDFTTSGHFVVLTGVDSDGKITVNDSNSKKNSNKAWKIDDLMSQIRDLWVYQ